MKVVVESSEISIVVEKKDAFILYTKSGHCFVCEPILPKTKNTKKIFILKSGGRRS